ncbi:MAG: uroporphyrinogen-III synthase [Campylobacterales bacterium]|nr:uroporphyrinogen-III synthase [Campylobacterales bacterium]
MKTIVTQLSPLYYEYDAARQIFWVAQSTPSKDYALELVSITHQLQSRHIPYTVDGKGNIRIGARISWSARMCEGAFGLVRRFTCSPVYLTGEAALEGVRTLGLFEIKPLPCAIDLGAYDALVFTSKNAVEVLDKQYPQWKRKAAYAIAPQSAKAIKRLGGQLRFVGKSHYGNQFALELGTQLEHKRVLYVRAKEVASDLAEILRAQGVACDEAVIYETCCKPQSTPPVLPKKSVIIFSAPSNVACFLQHVSWDESYRAVAIGNTTAAAFPEGITPVIAEHTSLESCLRKARELSYM